MTSHFRGHVDLDQGQAGILQCDGRRCLRLSAFFPSRVNVPLLADGGGDRLFSETTFTHIHTVVDSVVEECGLSFGLLRGMKTKRNTVLKIQFLGFYFLFLLCWDAS